METGQDPLMAMFFYNGSNLFTAIFGGHLITVAADEKILTVSLATLPDCHVF